MTQLSDINLNPKNRNKHPKEQIARLADILRYQGWRHPLIVSKLNNELVVGHGRYAAAKLLGLKEVPVMYQDFDSPEHQYAFGVADNAINSWSELDMAEIHLDIQQLDSNIMPIEMLGIEDFRFEPPVNMQLDSGITPQFKNILQITLENENETGVLYKELKDRGLDVKVLSI